MLQVFIGYVLVHACVKLRMCMYVCVYVCMYVFAIFKSYTQVVRSHGRLDNQQKNSICFGIS